jgi:hypothetical protein
MRASQTVLQLTASDESLTAHAGLVLFDEYLGAMGIAGLINHELPGERFNLSTNSVVSCQVHDRVVNAWTFSTMCLMLFFDGRYPRYAFPVLAEYIRPNV